MREPLGLRHGCWWVCKAAARVSWLVIVVAESLVGVGGEDEDGRRMSEDLQLPSGRDWGGYDRAVPRLNLAICADEACRNRLATCRFGHGEAAAKHYLASAGQ
jgi:hypothetical protein